MSTSTPYGVAIIGASMRSTMMIDFLQRNPQHGFVAGIYDFLPARAALLIEHNKIADAKVYDSFEQAVSDDRVGIVFVGTPDCAHVDAAVRALGAGRHVYCEKPLATTLEDCDRIADAARSAKGVFYLGMNLRHTPVQAAMHDLLTDGKLGRLLTIEANEYYTGGKTYFRRWNRLRKFGGGLWITKACHDFDLLNWFAGGKPQRVFASASLSHYTPRADAATHCRICPLKDTCNDVYSQPSELWDRLAELTEEATGVPRDLCLFNSEKDTFDNGIAVVEYDNDVRATYTANVVSSRDTRQLRLTGTDGAAEGDTATCSVTWWDRATGKKTVIDLTDQMNSGHGGADERIMADFFHCCRTGAEPLSDWRDGRLSLAVGLTATQSSDMNEAVELADLG